MKKSELVAILSLYNDNDEVTILTGKLPLQSIKCLNEKATLVNGKVVFTGEFISQGGTSKSGYEKKGNYSETGKRLGRPPKKMKKGEEGKKRRTGERGRPRKATADLKFPRKSEEELAEINEKNKERYYRKKNEGGE